MSDRLYATVPPNRFFRIPSDADVPEGDLLLQGLTGDRIRVSAEAAAAWELDEEQAKLWVQQRAGVIAGGVGSFLSRAKSILEEVGAVQHAAAQAASMAEPAIPAPDATGADDPGPSPAPTGDVSAATDDSGAAATEQRVADALGIERENLTDPDIFLDGFKKMAEGIKDTMEAMARANPATPDQVRDRMSAFGDALRREKIIEGTPGLEGLSEQLGKALSSPELVASLEAATERLRMATETLRSERQGPEVVPAEVVPPAPDGTVGDA